MSFFKNISEELTRTYSAAGIKTIKKTRSFDEQMCFYQSVLNSLPAALAFDALALPAALAASYVFRDEVSIIDPFLSLSDVQNDVKALFIKPLACIFLSHYYFQRCLYEFALGAIHLLTLSPSLAVEHATNGFASAAKSILYNLWIMGEFFSQLCSLVIRSTISVGSGEIRNLVSGDESRAPDPRDDFPARRQ